MKKIFVFSAFIMGLAGIVPNVAHADKQTCQIRETDTCDNDNEYLSIDGVRGCYVCEKGKCVTGDLVVATNARLSGKNYHNYKFRCQLGWDDEWIAESIKRCPDRWQKVENDEHASQKIINPNTGEPMFNDNSSQVVTGADPCLAWICDRGYHEVNGKCVDDSNQQHESAPTPKPDPVPVPSCREDRTTVNGKACCDTGKSGKYDEKADTCTCSGNLEFIIENGKGFCRAVDGSTTPDEAPKPTPVPVQELSAEQQLCDKIADAHMVGDECKCDDSAKELNRAQQRCVDSAETISARERNASLNRITSIMGKINNLKSGLGTSVWKDREGNFNTSRLVSDSVAGVVLGTAGGLITSKVMKKNQLKSGFEDINCTIRGQTVAGYGDEFQVGIQ